MSRAVLLALALAALAGAGACTTHCQELGDRFCGCVPSGTQRDTCKQQIKNALGGSTQATEDLCSCLLGTCNAPAGSDFCEWQQLEAAKVDCGLARPDPAQQPQPAGAACYPQTP